MALTARIAAAGHINSAPCCRRTQHTTRAPSQLGRTRPFRRREGRRSAGGSTLCASVVSVPQVCFDNACQQAADQAFLLAVCLPLVVFAAALAYIYRQREPDDESLQGTFEDPETGIVFEAPEGMLPEMDRKGELAYRVTGYTPWPVEEGYEGERLRIRVGPVARKAERTFVFKKVLPGHSRLLTATLPRPLGIVFDEDAARRRVVVGELLEGGNAEQRYKVAKLNQTLNGTAAVGDVLRGVTCTTFVYQGAAAVLLAAQPPVRTVVLYCADGQTWPQVVAALRKGDSADGEVTLVLERRQAAGQGGE